MHLPPDKWSESILVVPRTALALNWQGLKTTALAADLARIEQHAEFQPRGLMEQDENYKQIIPYLIFQYQDQLFLMQRAAQASEARLQQRWTLGIGGHLRAQDLASLTLTKGEERPLAPVTLAQQIFAWAQREFHEEVSYHGQLQLSFLGLLNDDSNSVGRVHLGLVLLVQGDRPEIQIKTELQQGQLCSIAACREQQSQLESWSQIVFERQWAHN